MKNEGINILFIGGAKRLSLAERFVAAGRKLEKKVSIYSYELSTDVPIYEIAKIIVGLKWNNPKLESHLLDTINKYKINIILPFVDPAIGILSALKEKLDDSIFIPISDFDLTEILYDKIESNKWFTKKKFPVPPNDMEVFPLIAKPRKGSASQGILIIETKYDLKDFISSNKETDFLIQKYIDAVEYTVDCYVSGKYGVIGAIPRERVEVVNGEVTQSITKRNIELINLATEILESHKFRGPITIQFLVEKGTGIVYLMEINPRFGGGVLNSIEAGFDIPGILLKEFLNYKIKPISNWKDNLLMMRVNREIFKCK